MSARPSPPPGEQFRRSMEAPNKGGVGDGGGENRVRIGCSERRKRWDLRRPDRELRANGTTEPAMVRPRAPSEGNDGTCDGPIEYSERRERLDLRWSNRKIGVSLAEDTSDTPWALRWDMKGRKCVATSSSRGSARANERIQSFRKCRTARLCGATLLRQVLQIFLMREPTRPRAASF